MPDDPSDHKLRFYREQCEGQPRLDGDLEAMSAVLPEPSKAPLGAYDPFDGMRFCWGPQGPEYARFRLSGDMNVRILLPAAGNKDLDMEVLSGCDGIDGTDRRQSIVLRLPKARARALASAIMGAASEL